MYRFSFYSVLTISSLINSLRSEFAASSTNSISGRSLREESIQLDSSVKSSLNEYINPNSEVTKTSERYQVSQIIESISQVGKETTEAAVASEPPEPAPKMIDLHKRMLKKTRHITEYNRRLRRRSPQNGGANNKGVRMTLDPRAVQSNAFTDGIEAKGQAPSLISKNNFINFCISRFGKVGGAIIMNGKQLTDKPACNGVVMGMVPDKNHMPACKFIQPTNLEVVPANKDLRVVLALRNLIVGVFTNPKKTYLDAPVQIDPETKNVLGHTHIVAQSIDSLNSTAIPDPSLFFFFKGIDEAAENGKVSVVIDKGLPKGFWRLSTINTAANHQPISSPIAQRSIYDDIIYITAE